MINHFLYGPCYVIICLTVFCKLLHTFNFLLETNGSLSSPKWHTPLISPMGKFLSTVFLILTVSHHLTSIFSHVPLFFSRVG